MPSKLDNNPTFRLEENGSLEVRPLMLRLTSNEAGLQSRLSHQLLKHTPTCENLKDLICFLALRMFLFFSIPK